MQIAVAGTGYVGLSLSVLLAQHNEVTAVDIIREKVEKINNKKSPIVDKEIEEYKSILRKIIEGQDIHAVATLNQIRKIYNLKPIESKIV